jgi:hypothetical protein
MEQFNVTGRGKIPLIGFIALTGTVVIEFLNFAY